MGDEPVSKAARLVEGATLDAGAGVEVNGSRPVKASAVEAGQVQNSAVTKQSNTVDQNEDPIVSLADVHFSFGPLRVLDGVSLNFYRGQITVIIGPSGAGKSVLLKNIVGLLKPDRGQIYFGKQRIDTLNEQQLVAVRKKVGFLFQMSALFDSMTVGENVCFPLMEHAKLSKAEQAKRCADVLRIVGLSGIEPKMPADLSGGQRKRVALARAIILEPEVMLYDEPTTGLDPIRSDVINELILSLSRRLRITSIVVTHDMVSANKIADRMVMLYDGKIIADADRETFKRSENPIVQRFIRGQANDEDMALIRGGLESNNQKVASPG